MKETIDQKANRLLRTGCVRFILSNDLVYQCEVQGDHGTYDTLIYSTGNFFCTCEWGKRHSFGRYRCSHAIATQMHKEGDWKWTLKTEPNKVMTNSLRSQATSATHYRLKVPS